MLNRIIVIFILPLRILNCWGEIVGGVWLAFKSEWKLIGIGIFLLFTSHRFLSILMGIRLPITGIFIKLYEKRNPLCYFLGFLSQFYTNLLIIASCAFAFFVCSSFYKGDIGIGYIPYLLWSWGMGLAPWSFFVSKEPENEFSWITLFSASVFYFLFLISIFISPIVNFIIIILFCVVQLIVLPIFNIVILSKARKYECDL